MTSGNGTASTVPRNTKPAEAPSQQPAPTEERKRERFDVTARLMALRGKGGVASYLPVQARVDWLRHDAPESDVKQEHIEINDQWALFKTTVVRIVDGEVCGRAEAYGMEFSKNFPDYALKAATKSLGRALNALGYGGSDIDEDEEDTEAAWSTLNRDLHFAAGELFSGEDAHKVVHDLVCGRWGLTSVKDAAIEQLRAVAVAVKGMGTPGHAKQCLFWVRSFAAAGDDAALTKAAADAKKNGVDSDFARQCWKVRKTQLGGQDRTAPTGEAPPDAQMAATDRRVRQVVRP